jgi:hypothetical protein
VLLLYTFETSILTTEIGWYSTYSTLLPSGVCDFTLHIFQNLSYSQLKRYGQQLLSAGCLVKNRGWTISAAGQKLRILLRVIGMDILRKTVWYSARRCFSVCGAHFAPRRRGGASPTHAFPDLEPTLSQLGMSWHVRGEFMVEIDGSWLQGYRIWFEQLFLSLEKYLMHDGQDFYWEIDDMAT